VYGPGYWQLVKNSGLYVFACEIGGVHPAFIEAMAAEKPILYLDTPENRETAGDAAMPFHHNAANLASRMAKLLADETRRNDLAKKALARAESAFNWETITREYESLFAAMLQKRQ
jgi:glycosyltransferase involved in cell wall biosynthesis